MPVTFHSYDDASDVPESVQGLVELMKRPLRNTQRLASLPSMSPLALAQLQHIPNRASDADPSTSDDSLDKISSVANLVLLTSKAIEESVHDSIEARPTISHWYTLLRTIAQSSHPDAHVMGDVSFIYPQGFDGESGESTMLVAFSADESLLRLNLIVQGGLDSDNAVPLCMEHHLGIATDEMSTSESGIEEESLVDEKEHTSIDHESESSDDKTQDQDEIDDDMDEDEDDMDEDDTGSSPYDETKDHPMFSAAPRPPFNFVPHPGEAEQLGHVDEDESSDEPCLDLPLEAHILAERRTWPSVLFPVLCIASEDDIVPLVASSAYQRWAWGIDLPIVGLEISRYGSIARVHIGWVDPSSDPEHMPSVRITRPLFSTGFSPVAQGLFNLATPQSALELASFVLALGYQLDVLRHELPSRRLSKIKWRADNDPLPWAESIHDWCISLDTYNRSSTTDSSDGCFPITPTSNLVSFDMSRKSKDNTPGQTKKAGSTSSTIQSGAQSPPAVQTEVSIAKKAKTSVSRFSCSVFAQEPLRDVVSTTYVEPTIASWMLQRFAFTLARMPGWEPPKHKSTPPRFQDMMKSYEELSCLSWPKRWTALETLPQVDSCLTSHREKLFEGYVKRQQAGTEIVDLDEGLAKIMESRLSLLLKSVAGAYTKEARPIAALEAESRHDFDALFCNFFVNDAQQVTSPEVLFERQLRLPLNTLLEGLTGARPAHYSMKLCNSIRNWAGHNRRLWEFLLGDEDGTPIQEDEDDTLKHKDEDNTPSQVDEDGTPRQDDTLRQANQTMGATDKLMTEFDLTYSVPATAAQTLRSTVERQSIREPNRGTCDAIMVTVVPLPTEAEADTAYTASRFVIANYKHLTGPAKTPEVQKSKVPEERVEHEDNKDPDSKQEDTTSKNEGTTGELRQEKRTEPTSEMYDFPLCVESGDYPPFKLEIDPSLLSTKYILLPQISVEYKRPTDKEKKALNQARIYCISNAIYLGTLGIKNFPVFSLPVHGTRASLIMAWKADNGNVYLVERNVRKFDILDPIQAFHLATVILRIKAREQELIKLYNAHKEPYETNLKSGTYKIWAMPESNTTVAPPPSTGALTSTNEVAE